MKKIIYIICCILLLTDITIAQCQCNVEIVQEGGDPECLLTAYTDKGFPITDNFADEQTTLVCRGETVTYTINNPNNITSCMWVVNGSDNYAISDDSTTIVVTWNDSTAQQVSLQVIIVYSTGETCMVTKNMYILETPILNTTVLQGFVEESDGTKTITVCKGEMVEFIDNSQYTSNTNITGYYWGTDNYGSASTKNFKIENISVDTKVIHKIMSYCGCEAEEIFIIKVLPERALKVSCHGTACEGSIATYSVEDINCSQYNWVVENGTIIGNTDTSRVTVQWGAPESGYGVISLDGSECDEVCPKIIPVKIPIISSNVVIAGDENVCQGSSVVFELPLWGSTNYTWQISPSIPMYNAENVNKKIIKFSGTGTYTLTCKIRCPFLDCGELTLPAKTITVKPVLEIQGATHICLGGSTSFTTNASSQNAASNLWSLSKNNQVLATYTGSTFSYNFTQIGTYKLEVSNADYCNTAIKYIESQPLPLPNIVGKDEVCPNDGDSLTVTNPNRNYWVEWNCNALYADPQNLTSDSSFVVKFNGVVGDVTARFVDKKYGCQSDVSTFAVREVLLDNLPQTPNWRTEITGKKAGDTIRLQVEKQNNVFYRWFVPSGRATILTDFIESNAVLVVNRSKDGNYPDFIVVLKRILCNNDLNPVYDTIVVKGVTESKIIVSGNNCRNNPITFSTNRADTNNSHYIWIFDGVEDTNSLKTIQHSFTTTGHKIVKLKYQIANLVPYIQTVTLDIYDCNSLTTNSLNENNELTDSVIANSGADNIASDLPCDHDTIGVLPLIFYNGDFNLYYDCNTNSVCIDKIKYGVYPNMVLNNYSPYLCWKKDGGEVHSINPITDTCISVSTYGYGRYIVTFFDRYLTFTKEITVYPPTNNLSATITHPIPVNNEVKLCSESPYVFSADISGDYDYCYWDWGNGSITENNPIEYAFVYDEFDLQNGYLTCIVAVDRNGCQHRLDSIICKPVESPKLGKLAASEPVCPGGYNKIVLQSNVTNLIYPILWTPEKNEINDNGNIMEYLAYETGDYFVKIQDTTGCISESRANVYFNNKPVADFIEFSPKYCEGTGFIACFQDNGYSYDWKITSNGQTVYEQYSVTSNTCYVDSFEPGTYVVNVTVYTDKNCSDSTSGIFTIYPNPSSPTLTIDPNHACVHIPPVILNGTPAEVYWSNGTHGDNAYYYQSGYVNAYVIDPISGCSSSPENIYITPAPNFDALLTGCYEKCTPVSMETFGLSPIPLKDWSWNLNGSSIQTGTEQNPVLDIPEEGLYDMKAEYGNYGCSVQSDYLQIIKPDTCNCDSIIIEQLKTDYEVKDCKIIYEAEILICNNSDNVLNIYQWLSQQGVNIINIQGNSSIAPHNCETFILTFEVNPSLNYASFTIFDKELLCKREFALTLNHKENIQQRRCEINVEDTKCSTDGLVVDMYFLINLTNPANIISVWSEPQGIVTYNYDNNYTIDGFAVFDFLKLTQMANNNEEICFYVLMCEEDVLCIAKYCIAAADVLRYVNNKSQKQKDLKQQTDDVYLLPNPATNEVKIVGLTKEQITSLVVMDLSAKELIRNHQTNAIDISKIEKGSYLVVVKDNNNKIYYLKLIKQ